jgi:hypothetical protein
MVLLLLVLLLILLMLLLPIIDDGDSGDSAGISDSVIAIVTAAMITMTITARMIVLFIIHHVSHPLVFQQAVIVILTSPMH